MAFWEQCTARNYGCSNQSRRLAVFSFLALASIFFWPTQSTSAQAPQRSRRSSAEKPLPAQTDVPQWEIESTEFLSIGTQDGQDPYILLSVFDAGLEENGHAVVGLSYRRFFEIRYFDEKGIIETSVGRYGEGPFEFGSGRPTSFGRLAGDSILVVGRDHRFAVFGPNGERNRAGRFALPGGAIPSAVLDPTHLVLWSPVTPNQGARSEPQTSETRLLVADVSKGTVDTLPAFPGRTTVLGDDGLFLHLPFQPNPRWAAGNGVLWFGWGGGREIHGYQSGNPNPVEIVLEVDARQVTQEDRDRWKEYDLIGTDGEVRRGYMRHHRRVPFPEFFPVFQDLQVDVHGNLWVQAYEPPWSEEDFRWTVFNPEGERIAEARAPFTIFGPGLRRETASDLERLLEIGTDYFLVRQLDELGVERIKGYRLLR